MSGEAAVEMHPVILMWLHRLHCIVGGASTAEEARVRVESFALLLTIRFEPSLFTLRSLDAIAGTLRFWPSYGELVEKLRVWRRESMPSLLLPAPPVTVSPDRPPPSEAERAAVAWMVRRCTAVLRGDPDPGPHEPELQDEALVASVEASDGTA